MTIPAFITFDEVLNYPSRVVGESTRWWRQLADQALPVTPRLVVTAEAYGQLVKENNGRKTEAWYWSPELTTELHQLYHQVLGGKTVRLALLDSSSTLLVEGEANLIESINELWAKLKPSQTDTPLVIQPATDVISSGVAYTIHPFTHAKVLVIHSVWGHYDPVSSPIHHQTFEIDSRTLNIIRRDVRPQLRHLELKDAELTEKVVPRDHQTQPSLDDSLLAELAELIQHVKRTHLDHFEVRWALTPRGLVIEDCKTMAAQLQLADQPSLIATGASVSSGVVQAQVRVIKNLSDWSRLKPGEIVVVTQLTAQNLPNLTHAAGLIIEHVKVAPQLFKAIKQLSLPAISGATRAMVELKTGQDIILHAAQGKVYHQLTSTTEILTTSQKHRLKLLSSLHTEHDLGLINQNDVDGWYLSKPPSFELPKHLPIWYRVPEPNLGNQNQLLAELKQRLAPHPPRARLVITGQHSPSQLKQTIKTLAEKLGTLTPDIEWWLELSLPIQSLHLPAYWELPIAGIVINLPLWFHQLLGLDRLNSEAYQPDQHDTMAIQQELKRITHQVHEMPSKVGDGYGKVWVSGWGDQTMSMNQALAAGVDGVIASPEQNSIARRELTEYEETLWQPSKP